MKYKLFIVSFILLAALTTVPHNLQRIKGARGFTQHWAMAVLFWTDLLETPANLEAPLASATQAPLSAAAPGVPTVTGPAQDGEFRWNGRVGAGQAIEVKGVNGNVRAEGSSGNQVEVLATKKGRRSNPAEVEIRVVEHAGGVTICAVYPSPDNSRPNDCQPGSGGRMNTRDNDTSVDFTVRVPAGVRFIGRTVNGGVEANGLGSDVEVSTVNGSIEASASGIVSATTVNGSIKASMGSANWSSDLRFNTVNGSITLDLPSSLSTNVQAETLNGDITSDFQMDNQNAPKLVVGKRLSGTIGGGGRELMLKTVNGDIRLQRRGGV